MTSIVFIAHKKAEYGREVVAVGTDHEMVVSEASAKIGFPVSVLEIDLNEYFGPYATMPEVEVGTIIELQEQRPAPVENFPSIKGFLERRRIAEELHGDDSVLRD